MKTYRLKKSLHLFRHALKMYRRKKNRLSESERGEVTRTLNELQEALLKKDREKAHEKAHDAERLYAIYLKKSPLEKIRDFIFGLGFALLVAVLIRTMWFELYEIPTGSMRPTLCENDRLVVSKTTFGINIPLKRGHFYFDEDLALRNGVMVFTGAGMDIANNDALYFYLFPGKKQYVKRLMGKPGDTLYFYGGQIFGIDKEGNDISKKLNPEFLNKIEHIPYIYLNGKREFPTTSVGGIFSPIILKQMNLPVAKLTLQGNRVQGTLLPPYEKAFEDYYDIWGFKDYGVARLLTRDQVKALTDVGEVIDAPLYMEITHHPTIKYPKIQREHSGRLSPSVGTTSSILPLKQEHLKTLMDNLYTARFIVKDGKVTRYGSPYKATPTCTLCPDLLNVPNGSYEFYYGKGYKVHFGGVVTELPKDHPLYKFTPERVQFFYNLGIDFLTPYQPIVKDQDLLPFRYVYYRNGDLYALGAPLMKKGDSTLTKFLEKEALRKANAPTYRPYFPFQDPGPPLKEDGTLDISFIKQKGLKIPEKHYLALGDNFAMSADSRDFGFVPEENIRGTPDFIFWPAGKRMGPLLQVSFPWITLPKVVVWVLALIGFGTYYLIHRKRYKLPQKID